MTSWNQINQLNFLLDPFRTPQEFFKSIAAQRFKAKHPLLITLGRARVSIVEAKLCSTF